MAIIEADSIDPEDVGPIPEDSPEMHPGVLSSDEERQREYIRRSDPLFFKWQRGEATEQEWLDEIAAIKAEYPEEAS